MRKRDNRKTESVVKKMQSKKEKAVELENLCLSSDKSYPKLIPLICLIQVIIHYTKTPEKEITYLELDPMKRHEFWRFLTTFLIHSGRGDDKVLFELHLWSNVLLQLWFGWPVEKVLKWRLTLLLYMSSVLFASLITSTFKPCESSVGSSDAVYGLVMINIVGHLMSANPSSPFWWKSGLLVFIQTFSTMFLPFFQTFAFVQTILQDFGPFADTAHLGGSLGGGLMGVVVMCSFSSHCLPLSVFAQRWKNVLNKTCCVVSVLIVIVTVSINIYYAVLLKQYAHLRYANEGYSQGISNRIPSYLCRMILS